MNEFLNISMSLVDAVRNRRSVRGFLDKQVPETIIRQTFELAQLSPSNSNIQPWQVFVASGNICHSIREELYTLVKKGESIHPDFNYPTKFEDVYRKRQVDCGMTLYKEMGIAREDKGGRTQALLRNFKFFNAPHMAFVCMKKQFPQSVAVDVGIYAQTLMLAFTAQGISTCAMGSMREHPQVTRKVFNIDKDVGILFGIAFGYEDTSVPANNTRMKRAPMEECVTFMS